MQLVVLISLLVAGALAKPSLFESKIVNGNEADQGEWPWQASIVKYQNGNWYYICGGSLLAKNKVVTAAHCVDSGGENICPNSSNYSFFKHFRDASDYLVILGDHSRSRTEGTEQTINIKSIEWHSGWVSSSFLLFPNDIAVMTLEEDAELNEHVDTIALGSSSTSTANCFITGWGVTESGSSSAVLMETSATVITPSACKMVWGSRINTGQICLLDSESGSCSGDSGGPLACKSGSTWYLMGVTSWGHSSCSESSIVKRYPSVYTRISSYVDWVKERL
ncbi:hypothetical protein ScPMuIL_005059 [Solemya velum]